MNCVEFVSVVLFFVNGGVVLVIGEWIVDLSFVKWLLVLMLICGIYDVVGDFVYWVGLLVKSGVGGGIVVVLLGEMVVCVWVLGFDVNGNLLVGMLVLEWLMIYMGRLIF